MSFKINKILTLFLITGCLFAQTITNVQARQKGLDIIITYDMAGKLKSGDEIKVEFSIDGGNNYISINNAVGDVGKNVTNGTGKEIFWQLLHSSIALENVKFKVIAKNAFPDISGTGMNGKEFVKKCLNEAGVAIVPGTAFGKNAVNYVRFSFAASKENISMALDRINKVIK